MKSRARAALMLAAIICLFASIASAQTKPNFSGAWKLNPQKSKYAGGDPLAFLMEIDHKEPALIEDWIVPLPGGEYKLHAEYSIGGKETEMDLKGRKVKTSAKWEGDTLVIIWLTEGREFKRKITLSADGKTLTEVNAELKDGREQSGDTVVFEKQ
jgi:hypothetical protein